MYLILFVQFNTEDMKETFITQITEAMSGTLTVDQMTQLSSVLLQTLSGYTLIDEGGKVQEDIVTNTRLLEIFLSAKLVEGCSAKTIKYYETTIKQLFKYMPKAVKDYTTDDLRAYLAVFQKKHKSSKVTIDNIRRIFSSFFSWLEDEDFILKSPVRRIHKVKTGEQVKEISAQSEDISEEELGKVAGGTSCPLLITTGVILIITATQD